VCVGSLLSAALAHAAPFAYITNHFDDTVSVLATATNTVIATVPVGVEPTGVAVTPDGAAVYVANQGSATVSVLATATNTVIATVPVGGGPFGVAVTPDGAAVYVANQRSATVSVLATATNTVIATVPVGNRPVGFGQFIGPAAAVEPVTTFCSTLGDDRKPSILDQDIFVFTGATGETVTLTLEAISGSTNTRATLLLTDHIDKVFFTRIDSSALPNTLQATLPAAGRYLVTVAEHPNVPRGSAFRGNYCVQLESSAAAWQSFAPTGGVETLLD
jgi:YVTN family beta-propeller protein